MAFEVHKWLMLSAVLLALAGIIMAFVEKGSQSLQSTHGQLGLAVMVLIVAQPIVGQLRPLKKHPSRPSWFALHWVIGVGTVAIAWANSYIGFDLATSKLGYDLDKQTSTSQGIHDQLDHAATCSLRRAFCDVLLRRAFCDVLSATCLSRSENLLSKLGGMLSFGGKPKKNHQRQSQALDHLSKDLTALNDRLKQANKRTNDLLDKR
ncbi:unnamed protein product [Closterium sp. Yama58-4]|nr:unnamed protein product [Closterium sp. Yama58-4]